jgi:FkbM family methyltransferase
MWRLKIRNALPFIVEKYDTVNEGYDYFNKINNSENRKEYNVGGVIFPKSKLTPIDCATFKVELPDAAASLLPNPEKYEHYYGEGPYELGEVKVEKGDIVFDCGANIGVFAVFASVLRGAKCIAFEPLPANDKVIRIFAAANKTARVKIAPYAVCGKVGTLYFTNSDSASEDTHIESKKDKNSIEVKCTTLDDFVEKHNIPRVDFIKADIEGAERDMLKGATEVLRKFQPKLALCTYHLPDDPEVMEKLILEANPNYVITHKYKKLYAYVPKE